MALKKDELLSMYHELVLIRRFEERAGELYASKEIGGVYLHLANGQEAVITGAIHALRETDHVITAYRDHGHAISRGVDPKYVMAEMFGKRTGTSGGKGGSMHIASKEHRFWGGYAIVGGHLPLATGIAMASHYRGDDEVTLSYIGDGASNNGYFHESLNLSGVWDLPVIWFIENNFYGMGTAVEEAAGNPILHERAQGYGIKDMGRIDGQDTLEVYEVVQEAAEYARENGPVLIEAMTYRYRGHGVSDRLFESDARADEMTQFKERDPITVMAEHIRKRDYVDTEAELKRIHERVEEEVEAAIKFARESAEPYPDELYTHVYV
ncbi:MAG: thiamine pyrophosphate-dependent enzyme [Chloroflexota bacterium]